MGEVTSTRLQIRELAAKVERMTAGWPYDPGRRDAITCGKQGEEWTRAELTRWMERAYRARA